MALRKMYFGAAMLAVSLSACDSGVAFPGFDERPVNDPETIPPPTTIPISAEDETPVNTDPAEEDVAEPEPIPADTPDDDPTLPPEDVNVDIEPEVPIDPEPEAPATDTPDVEEDSPAETEPAPLPDVEPAFSYHAPGSLTPGSGDGSRDETIYAPDMVFPILQARTFPQSMVFQPGGFRYAGTLPGDECIPQNYEYPWRDNFCERGRPARFKSASCPAGSGVHLGQDIRVGDGPTCEAMRREYRNNPRGITNYKVVAAEDGVISGISSYTVTLKAGPRTYRYLHMNMRALQVSVGDEVTAGEHLGYVSKDFGSTSTTFHLHFVLKVNTEDGAVFVPPYTSLVAAYERRENAPGERMDPLVNIASASVSWDPNEVFEQIE